MRSDDVEEALQRRLGASAGPQGIVITLRRHDEYTMLLEQIEALEASNLSLQQQISRMGMYPSMYLSALDELRIARKLLHKVGVDTSFIESLRG